MSLELEKFILSWQDNMVKSSNIDPKDPFHFFNAVNNGFQAFRKLDTNEKQKFIIKQRKDIADKIKQKEWIDYITEYDPILNIFENCFYQKKIPSGSSIHQYDIIFKIIPDRKIMFQYAIKSIDIRDYNIKNMMIDELMNIFKIYLNDLEKNEQKKISSEKKLKCNVIFKYYLEQIWIMAENIAFDDFLKEVRDPYKIFDLYYIPFIISYLPFHIYFIEDNSKDIISISNYYDKFLLQQKYDVNIVLLYHSPLQFENLGIMEYSGNNAIIHRQFTNDNVFIQKCYHKISHYHKNLY
jgi:hypothetical protein